MELVPRIVLIEDDLALIKYYKEILGEIGGFNISVISSLYDAFDWLKRLQEGKEEKPDLILLDIIMPVRYDDPKAIDFLKMARRHPQTKDLKIYAFTNYSEKETLEEFKREGIDKIMIKVHYSYKDLIQELKRDLCVGF